MKLSYYIKVFEYLRKEIPAEEFKKVFPKLERLFMERTTGEDYDEEKRERD